LQEKIKRILSLDLPNDVTPKDMQGLSIARFKDKEGQPAVALLVALRGLRKIFWP
jgi:hypothetical protein